MIFLDVQVPSINKTYDFELDEDMPVGDLLTKIAEIIAEKEELIHCPEDKMYLYALCKEKILNESSSLRQQEIQSGERLLLI